MSPSHSRRTRAGVAGAAVLAAAVGGAIGAVASATSSTDPAAASAAPVVTVTAQPPETVAEVTAPDVEAAEVDSTVTATAHPSVDDPDSLWVVVNKTRPLDPVEYVPGDLVRVDGVPGGSAQRMRAVAAAALVDMYEAASDDGAGFSVSTAYRSYGFQSSLFAQYAARRGADLAETFSARPGYSEHQTGLGADVYASVECRIKRCFAAEAAGSWIAEHGWEFGFIVRYPEGANDITGYVYEPWHVRYVGEELAAQMHEDGTETLEDALGLPAAPDYE
ncbi:M15 family metallopeptidase [Demequina sp. NBRC 110057]|uniref:M15 family metallopeptidase n=1 Tax=Demequina sp. NBRC 110057 TaxID=1570346 RepID=UPI000A0278AA|nr:M15 family metallopeptidase [Demequina sp. NBRC 110057]